MSQHPERQQIDRYRAGALAPAALVEVDRHLRDCPGCAALLSPDGSAAAAVAADRVVRRVMAQGAHLSFDQLEAVVDGSADVALQARVRRHLRWCHRCAGEMVDLQRHAARLRAPVAPPKAPRRSWIATLHEWRLPSMAGGTLVAVLVAGTAMHSEWRGAGGTQYSVPAAQSAGAGAATPFDAGALQQLDRVSPAAAEAFAQSDFARLASLLRPEADRGQPIAAEALGLLSANGWGVTRDLGAAARYWQVAARQGSASASRNLLAIGRE